MASRTSVWASAVNVRGVPPGRALALAASALLFSVTSSALTTATDKPRPAPDFPSKNAADWIGAPQTWDSLKGRVVLLDVWTFG